MSARRCLLLAALLSHAHAASADAHGAPAPAEPDVWDASGTFLHLWAATGLGEGLRFNNPYRLEQPLGETSESLSRSAVYAVFAAGIASGDPDGLQLGGQLELAVAMEGIPQEVIGPSLVALYRPRVWWSMWSRAGTPVVLEPDAGVGLELALGGARHLTAGISVWTELVGSLFYGAATQDVSITTIPMLALQLGLRADYEILP